MDLVPDDVEVGLPAVPGVLNALVQQVFVRQPRIKAAQHADLVPGFLVRGGLAEPGVVVNVQCEDQVPFPEPRVLPLAGDVFVPVELRRAEAAGRARIYRPACLIAGSTRRINGHQALKPFAFESRSEHQLSHGGPADVSSADGDNTVWAPR